MSLKECAYYVAYKRTVNHIALGGGEAQRRVQYAPPVVALARAKLHYERVVHSAFEGDVAVYSGGKVLFPYLRACAVEVSVFAQNAVAELGYFVGKSVHSVHCRLFVPALCDVRRYELHHGVPYFVLYGLVLCRVGVCAYVHAQIFGRVGLSVLAVAACGKDYRCNYYDYKKESYAEIFHAFFIAACFAVYTIYFIITPRICRIYSPQGPQKM